MTLIVLYLSSLGLAAVGAWFVAYSARGLGLLDRPNERSSHTVPTPKGGGVGILAVFIVTCATIGIPLTIWLPAVALSVFSLVGDRLELSPKLRLAVQFALAWLFLSGVDVTSWLPWSYLPAKALLSAFIVGTANVYNFMDGINGIAGITGVVGFGLLGLVSRHWFGGPTEYTSLCMCMSLACLGFLPFNIPRARVFMGDVGSILLGFLFAQLAILVSEQPNDFLCASGFLFPFYADELTTMFVRIRKHENLLAAHRRHIYQLLSNEGEVPHWKVSMGYGILQLCVGVTLLAAREYGIIVLIIVLGTWFGGFVAGSNMVRVRWR